MIVMAPTDDYMDTTQNYSVHYERPHPPYVREAPAVFFRKGKGYIITSGTSGKFPNTSETAALDDIYGERTILGDPHIEDEKRTSFDGQISCILKHPHKKDLYIAMADRWLTDLRSDMPSGIEYYAARFDADYDMSDKRRQEILNITNERYDSEKHIGGRICMAADKV